LKDELADRNEADKENSAFKLNFGADDSVDVD